MYARYAGEYVNSVMQDKYKSGLRVYSTVYSGHQLSLVLYYIDNTSSLTALNPRLNPSQGIQLCRKRSTDADYTAMELANLSESETVQ